MSKPQQQLGREIVAPGAWKGPEIDWKREGLHELSAAEIADIGTAFSTPYCTVQRPIPESST